MKKLTISILFIIVALFAVDRIGGLVLQTVNRKTTNYITRKIDYLAAEASEDIIFIGTSRTNFHYVPSIIGDSVGMSAYNGGIDGCDCIFSHYIALNLLLRHHTPKVICLELMTNDYETNDKPFEQISIFAPYTGVDARVDSVFRDAGSLWRYRVSHLYRYNSLVINNLGGFFFDGLAPTDNGYIPNAEPPRVPAERGLLRPEHNVDLLKIKYLQAFADICKSKGIKLVFTISPMLFRASEDLYGPISALAARNEIPLLDYHSCGLFQDHPEYFRDAGHLWDKGAREYSTIFAHDLKRVLGEVSR